MKTKSENFKNTKKNSETMRRFSGLWTKIWPLSDFFKQPASYRFKA